ncbi:MAG: MCE family protein [Candidatus Omnitrophica bacterium]|nr:MCE family protein [Candidatus Omnitrophota bacterium]
MKKLTNEFKVGLFFLACILGLIYITFSTGKVDIKNEGYNLYVVFNEIAGLDTKAPVMLNGREVGKVEDITITNEADETKITLKLWLAKEAKVREGAKASIKTLGLMGEKYIQITSAKGTGFLKPNATLIGKPYMDLDALMDEALDITDDIGVLVNNVNSLTDEVKKLSINLNHTVEGNQDKISQIVDNLETTSKNMEEFTEDIKRHPWKLLYRNKDSAPAK